MVAAERCDRCRFFHPYDGGHFAHTDGMCRRYAPSGPTVGDGRWQVFPPMNSNQWCGDYRPSAVAAAGAAANAA